MPIASCGFFDWFLFWSCFLCFSYVFCLIDLLVLGGSTRTRAKMPQSSVTPRPMRRICESSSIAIVPFVSAAQWFRCTTVKSLNVWLMKVHRELYMAAPNVPHENFTFPLQAFPTDAMGNQWPFLHAFVILLMPVASFIPVIYNNLVAV